MNLLVRHLILTGVLLVCQLTLFAAVLPSRLSRKATIFAANGFATACLLVYGLVCIRFGPETVSQSLLLLYAVPTALFFLALSRCRDGRFWFIFFFCNTVIAVLSEGGYLLATMLAPGSSLVMLLLRILLMVGATALILTFLRRPFLDMMDTQGLRWAPLAVTAALLEVLLYFTAAYPAPISTRPDDFPTVLLILAVIIAVFCTHVAALGNMKQSADSRMLLAMSRNQYEIMRRNQDQLRHARHDMLHHLKLVDGLALQGDVEGVRSYLGGLLKDVERARAAGLCRSRVGDLVLSWYESEAGSIGADYFCQADIPEERGDASVDLCAVLSNALQNAVEGCRQAEGKRFVRVVARPKGASLLLTVENSCTITLTVGEELPATTKEDDGHGVGLSSIKAIAARRSGFFKLSADKGVFTLSVALGGMF